MARTRRVKVTEGNAHYHVMSRVNDQAFLFNKAGFRSEMVGIMNRVAEFTGVEIKAYTMMSNHFHMILHVVKPVEVISDEVILKRITALYGREKAESEYNDWMELKANGSENLLALRRRKWLRRMHDISEFSKTFKELIVILYKHKYGLKGSLWGARFKSTMFQDGKYLQRCIRYIELNAVRAGMVKRIKDYPFSSHHTAEGGFAGTVPAEGNVYRSEMMKRVPQIGGGKILGDLNYVQTMIGKMGKCFYAGRTFAHMVRSEVTGAIPIGEAVYSSHGYKLKTVA